MATPRDQGLKHARRSNEFPRTGSKKSMVISARPLPYHTTVLLPSPKLLCTVHEINQETLFCAIRANLRIVMKEHNSSAERTAPHPQLVMQTSFSSHFLVSCLTVSQPAPLLSLHKSPASATDMTSLAR